MSNSDKESNNKKDYVFGEIKEYDLEKIESEVLQESVYLDVFAGSDLTLKTNVCNLMNENIFEKVINLNTYKFNYKEEEIKKIKLPEGEQFGLMAQEIEQVFPELIQKNNEGKMFVNYTQMIPLLLETIKSLNAKVEVLEKKINN